jgi:uncharacterized membrane protein
MPMKTWAKWGGLTVLLAGIFHLATVWLFPLGIMTLVSRKVERESGLGLNQWVHAPPTTAASREVVMPSPDLLYSILAFDLSEGPLQIRARVPDDTYWSLSFYGANTDNFWTINDRQAPSKQVDLVLVGPGEARPNAGQGAPVVSPTRTGVVIARTLVKDGARLDDLVRTQKQAHCRTLER